jgi:DNA polymerase-3 subunit delta'
MNFENRIPSFSRIIGQERAVDYLKRVIAGEKVPHAYLFTGIPGVGKTTTAVAFVRAINCQEPADGEGCGHCRICRQMAGGNFPDLMYIKPDGQNIKIEQIRGLTHTLSFKPMAAKYRACIIQRAEMMTEEAANSFLKTLEEPPAGNIFILKTIEPLDLLPTIVSRCQKIPFRPIPFSLIEAWLKREEGMDQERASLIARVSDGSLGKAIDIVDTDFLEDRQAHLLNIIQLPTVSKEKALEMALEYSGKAKKGAQAGSRNDADIYEVMGIWKTWYRDLILMKAGGAPGLLVNIDFTRKLKNLSKKYTIDDLIDSFLLVDQAQRDLMRNPNISLMMEHTIMRLKGLCGSDG